MSIAYENGNCRVKIWDDGTKIRYVPDGEEPKPEFPESIDLKITDYCDMNCPMCHENSSENGTFASLHDSFLNDLPAGLELAIGGGNPLSHPGLKDFLMRMKEQKVICNLTVHWWHFEKWLDTLKALQSEDLIKGLGVSVNENVADKVLEDIAAFPNAVVHCVAGIVDALFIRKLLEHDLKVLILGYKIRGRGLAQFDQNGEEILSNIDSIRSLLNSILNDNQLPGCIALDNLAVKQLDLKNIVDESLIDQCYLGEDGEFSMYIDLVKGEYAVSSTAMQNERKEICDVSDVIMGPKSLRVMFADVRRRIGK